MFHFKKKELNVTEVELHAIIEGKVIPLTQVPDKVFADGMMGNGVGFSFEGDTIYAPCNGEIVMLANTRHAIGMRLENGAELLIHVGLDTVNLGGRGLKALVKQGNKVKQGQAILQIDTECMKENSIDITTPMVLMADDQYLLEILQNDCNVNLSSIVMRIRKE